MRLSFAKRRAESVFDALSHVAIAAGGTGGHIVPAMRVASELIKAGKQVCFITDKRFFNYTSLFEKQDFYLSPAFRLVQTPIVSPSSSAFDFAWTSIFTFFQSVFLLLKARPQAIIGFGGYASFFPLLAGLFTFRSIIIHEQNAAFGRVNRFFLRVARFVLLTFPDLTYITKKQRRIIRNKLVISGFPNFLEIDFRRRSARTIHNVATKRTIEILITGGGQGASFFTKNVPPAIVSLAREYPEKTFIVYHQVRQGEIDEALAAYGNLRNIILDIKPLFNNIPELLTHVDIAIIRGGAGSIAEVAASKVFAIVIPMPDSAEDHQLKNAICLSKSNAGVLLRQETFGVSKLFSLLNKALREELFYFGVVDNAYDFFKKEPAKVFMSVILYNDLSVLHDSL